MRIRKSLSSVLAVGVTSALLTVGGAVTTSQPAGAQSAGSAVKQAVCKGPNFLGVVTYRKTRLTVNGKPHYVFSIQAVGALSKAKNGTYRATLTGFPVTATPVRELQTSTPWTMGGARNVFAGQNTHRIVSLPAVPAGTLVGVKFSLDRNVTMCTEYLL